MFFSLWRGCVRSLLALSVIAGVLLISPEGRATLPKAAAPTPAPIAKADLASWILDLNGDGVADVANPTLNFIRGEDAYGSGRFGATRDHGGRRHEGTDFIAAPGAAVLAPLSGVVTKMGFAYGGNSYLRFVELTDAAMRLKARIFYVDPAIHIGQTVAAGEVIGAAQDLSLKYPFGITNHVHVEISDKRGVLIDPARILPPTSPAAILATLKLDESGTPGKTAHT